MFTSAEAQELRVYCSRYPIDDESNVWLPHGFLMAKVSNMMGGNEPKTVKDFMPFANRDEPEPEVLSEPKPYTRKHLKRIMKSRGW